MNSLKSLTDPTELEEFLESSFDRPLLVFKHSSTCGTSHAAHEELMRFLQNAQPGFDTALITVQAARPLSNLIADRLGIPHQSPQALLVRNGKAVWHKSHHNITFESLSKAIQENAPHNEPSKSFNSISPI